MSGELENEFKVLRMYNEHDQEVSNSGKRCPAMTWVKRVYLLYPSK